MFTLFPQQNKNDLTKSQKLGDESPPLAVAEDLRRSMVQLFQPLFTLTE
jgi:hypothetical protein